MGMNDVKSLAYKIQKCKGKITESKNHPMNKDFTGEEYPCPDVINGWVSQRSLGEVHTVVMCALLSYDCFLSDDRDAAKYLQGIVDRRLSWKVNIYNRQNRCEYIRTLPPELRSNLSRNELRMLSHKLR